MSIVDDKSIKDNLKAVLRIGKDIQSSLDYKTTLKRIIKIAEKTIDCEAASLLILSEDKKNISFFVVEGEKKENLAKSSFPASKGIAGQVISSGKSLIVNDVSNSPLFYSGIDKQSGFVTRSILASPLKIKGRTIGLIEVVNKKQGTFDDNDLFFLEAISSQAAVSIENSRLYTRLSEAYLETIEVVVSAIDARDPYTFGHSKRVSEYSLDIAKELGYKKDMKILKYGAILHDIGKIGVPDGILRKPGKLTFEEYGSIKKHPGIGAELITKVSFLNETVPFIKYHHERIDGNGYPEGVKGNRIPFEARIIAVADTFDALTSNRPYRKSLSLETARDELLNVRNTQLDSSIVDVFAPILKRSFRRANKDSKGS